MSHESFASLSYSVTVTFCRGYLAYRPCVFILAPNRGLRSAVGSTMTIRGAGPGRADLRPAMMWSRIVKNMSVVCLTNLPRIVWAGARLEHFWQSETESGHQKRKGEKKRFVNRTLTNNGFWQWFHYVLKVQKGDAVLNVVTCVYFCICWFARVSVQKIVLF